MQQSEQPAFSVSHSSGKRLDTCARAHFWAVYGSWGGWSDALGLDDPRRLAYILKQGKGMAGVVGDAVHAAVGTAVDARRVEIPVTHDGLRKRAVQHFVDACEATVLGKYAAEPKAYPPVMEVFYQEPGWDARFVRYREELDAALDALFVNQHFLAVEQGLVEVVYCEDVHSFDVVLPRPTDDIPFGGEHWTIKVWTVPDLVYRVPSVPGRRVIVDWKTGRIDDTARAQIGVYAAWLSQKDGIGPHDIAAVAVFLPHYVEQPVQGSSEVVAEARESLRGHARKALAYVVDGDPVRNEPKPMEAFEQIPEGSKECKWCSFRRLCGRA